MQISCSILLLHTKKKLHALMTGKFNIYFRIDYVTYTYAKSTDRLKKKKSLNITIFRINHGGVYRY